MPGDTIERETMPLEPGDTYVLYSDGVTEAMNEADDFLGEAQVLADLAASPVTTAADTVARVLDTVRTFVGGAMQSDDITVLAARYGADA